MANSIRENALRKVKELFESQTAGAPGADPYDFTWSVVRREPLGDLDSRKRYAVAILDTDETKGRQVSCVQVDLAVTIEFRSLMEVTENPSQHLNMILLNIQRLIRSDSRLATINGGTPLVIDFRDTGNTVDVDSYADRSVDGALFCVLKYKHAENDPRIVA